MTRYLDFELIQQLADRHGLIVSGLLSRWQFDQDLQRLQNWQQQGYSGEMTYMQRVATLFADFDQLLPGTKAVVCFAVDYSAWPSARACPPGFGRVARYAWGQDYHKVLKSAVLALVADLKAAGYMGGARVFTDAVPLLERAIARQARLGFVGKNSMLIRPGQGSFFFLAELLLDQEVFIEQVANDQSTDGHCGSCQRCMDDCPTQAIVEPFTIDSRRCISYLSIEKRGMLNAWEQRALGDWVFGCDICQEVCPFNHTVLKIGNQPIRNFQPLPFIKDGLIDLSMILALRTEREFKRLFGESAIMRARRVGLLRNALSVCANQGALHMLPVLFDFIKAEKRADLRQFCAQTLLRLSEKCNNRERAQIDDCLQKFGGVSNATKI